LRVHTTGKERGQMSREVEVHQGPLNDRDDLDALLDEEMRDPAFREAYEDAAARSALLRLLVTERGERQVSQADVAARMGTTQSAVSDLERGATDPRLSTLQRYARAIGCALHIAVRTPIDVEVAEPPV
jgi:DNA-binding XRE family transcriptional regulator